MTNLVNCTACGKEISAEAKTCPGCGQPRKRRRIGALGGFLATISTGVILFFGALIVRGLIGPSANEQRINAAIARRAAAAEMGWRTDGAQDDVLEVDISPCYRESLELTLLNAKTVDKMHNLGFVALECPTGLRVDVP